MNWWLTIWAIGDAWLWKQTGTLDDGKWREVGNDVGSTVSWIRLWRRRMTTLDVDLVRHERSGSSWFWRLSYTSQIVQWTVVKVYWMCSLTMLVAGVFCVRCLRRFDYVVNRRVRRIQPAEHQSFIVEVEDDCGSRRSPPLSRYRFVSNRVALEDPSPPSSIHWERLACERARLYMPGPI